MRCCEYRRFNCFCYLVVFLFYLYREIYTRFCYSMFKFLLILLLIEGTLHKNCKIRLKIIRIFFFFLKHTLSFYYPFFTKNERIKLIPNILFHFNHSIWNRNLYSYLLYRHYCDMIKSVFFKINTKKKRKLNQEFYPNIICIRNNQSK